MPVNGGELLAKNIEAFGGGFLKHVNKTMGTVQKILDTKVERNMNLRDHNLSYLAKMDHPYAARHGSQGKPIHDPYWLIHTQSGGMLSAKRGGIKDAGISGGELEASAWVGIDEAVAYYALSVVYGTSKMIPRDFLTGSLYQAKDEAYAYLQTNLRDFVFNFAGVKQ